LSVYLSFAPHFRLKATDWGPLDVLVLDLPPGTGDVQLGVLQTLQLSGAVAVTTPSRLATEDAKKGLQMFTSLGVPTLAVVENMAYLDLPKSNADDGTKPEKYYMFGKKASNQLMEDAPVYSLPLSAALNECNEDGTPLMLKRPANKVTSEIETFEELGERVSSELLCLQYGKDKEEYTVTFASEDETFDLSTLVLQFQKSMGKDDNSSSSLTARFVSYSKAIKRKFLPASLRTVDPKTGDVLKDSPFLEYVETAPDGASDNKGGIDPVITRTGAGGEARATTSTNKRPPSILPVTVERRGRYGFAVEWGDGATIIYSMKAIARAAGGKVRHAPKQEDNNLV